MRIKNLETSRKREVALLLVARKNSQNLQNSQKRAHLRPEAKTAKRLEISGWPWAKTTVEMFHISEMPKACKFVGAQNPRDTLWGGNRTEIGQKDPRHAAPAPHTESHSHTRRATK